MVNETELCLLAAPRPCVPPAPGATWWWSADACFLRATPVGSLVGLRPGGAGRVRRASPPPGGGSVGAPPSAPGKEKRDVMDISKLALKMK